MPIHMGIMCEKCRKVHFIGAYIPRVGKVLIPEDAFLLCLVHLMAVRFRFLPVGDFECCG
jgi:hypothetical protein